MDYDFFCFSVMTNFEIPFDTFVSLFISLSQDKLVKNIRVLLVFVFGFLLIVSFDQITILFCLLCLLIDQSRRI